MKFLELKDISERYMRLLNPCSPEKIVKIGQMAGLEPGNRVIDFGAGFGESLALWASILASPVLESKSALLPASGRGAPGRKRPDRQNRDRLRQRRGVCL